MTSSFQILFLHYRQIILSFDAIRSKRCQTTSTTYERWWDPRASMWGHERQAACYIRHDEDAAIPSWLPTLNRHQWEQYWFAASGSAYASNIFTADTEKRNWIGSICLEQCEVIHLFLYLRVEICTKVKTLIVFFVTSHGYRVFRGMFFFKLKFGSEAWSSRFVRNLISHLGDYWHMSSRSSPMSNYTQLEKSTVLVTIDGGFTLQ
jgi:hypothetical protein